MIEKHATSPHPSGCGTSAPRNAPAANSPLTARPQIDWDPPGTAWNERISWSAGDGESLPGLASSSAQPEANPSSADHDIRSRAIFRSRAERFGDLALDMIHLGLEDWSYGAARTAAHFAARMAR